MLAAAIAAKGQCTPGAISGLSSLCLRDSTVLSDTTAGGVWTSSSPTIATINATTGKVKARDTGMAVISYTVCGSTTVTFSLTVRPLPDAGVIVGPNAVCEGSVIFLASTGSTGGTWSSSSSSRATVDHTGMVLGLAGGVTNIHYTVTNSYGCVADTSKTIIVNFAADAHIYGPASIRLGDTAIYSAYGFPNSWSMISATNASLVTLSTGDCKVTALAVGTATIFNRASSTSCGTDSAYFTININPPSYGATSSLFSSFINNHCSSPTIGVSVPAHYLSYTLVTRYGDGSIDTTNIFPGALTTITTFSHYYAYSGTYSIKQVLYNSTSPLDSVAYPYQHSVCNDLSFSLYLDANGNCQFDTASELLNMLPLTIRVDSNGTTIDSISVTSGFHFAAYGSPGTVYTFRLTGLDTAFVFPCIAGGIIYDTLSSSHLNSNKYVALSCRSTTGFDLAENATLRTGRHMATGSILLKNLWCTPQTASVSLHISPKYVFSYFSINPTSVTGNTATWNLSNVSSVDVPKYITYSLDIPTSTWLTPGDTVHTLITVSPTAGDLDTTNNVILRVDTVKSSYDPNHISVTPDGYILNGTKLHYAIEFENDGNDTAQNIFVMDTLSDYLDPRTLRLEGASASMDIALLHAGGHTIVKFDFPNIKLLDSTHHGRCTGTVMYSIKARTGLADGTAIYGHAGIYFDDNPVVLTDSSLNTVLTPHISIASALGDSVCHIDSVHFMATTSLVGFRHYQWFVNSTPAGTDSAGFMTTGLVAGNAVKCVMKTTMDDTVYTNSNIIAIHIKPLTDAGTISGAATVCQAGTLTLSETVASGLWGAVNSRASIAAGIVTGINPGADTVLYTTSNECGTSVAQKVISVLPSVTPMVNQTISPDSVVCNGDHVTFSTGLVNGGTAPMILWKVSGVIMGTGTIYNYVPANGDTVSCILVSNAQCATIDSVESNTITLQVIPNVTPGAIITASPSDTAIVPGQMVTFTAELSNCGSAPLYQWFLNGAVVTGATSSTYQHAALKEDTVFCVVSCNIPCAISPYNHTNTIITHPAFLSAQNLTLETGDIALYPNPNNGHFNLSGSVQSTTDDRLNYEIMNVLGQVVYRNSVSGQGGIFNQQINMDNAVAPGQYILKVYTLEGAIYKHFVIAR